MQWLRAGVGGSTCERAVHVSPHNFHREAHSIRKGAAPLIRSLVCAGNEELVDEIALRSHNLKGRMVRERAQDQLLSFRDRSHVVETREHGDRK